MSGKSFDPSQPLVKKYHIKSAFLTGNGLVSLTLDSGHSGPVTKEIPSDFILIDPAFTGESGPFLGSAGEIARFRNQVFEVKSYGDFTLQSIRKPTDENLADIYSPPEEEASR